MNSEEARKLTDLHNNLGIKEYIKLIDGKINAAALKGESCVNDIFFTKDSRLLSIINMKIKELIVNHYKREGFLYSSDKLSW